MATASTVTQITAPRVPLIDPKTGFITREWYLFFYNLYVVTGYGTGVTPVTGGGTGLSTIPSNGQLLIGNGSGYTLNTLTASTGINIANGAGAISIANAGVVTFSAGGTGLTPSIGTTGNVALAGTLIAANGGTGYSSYTIGDTVYANTTTTLAKLPVGTTGQVLTVAAGVPSWSSLGTIASQNANAVAISGGTINGTTVGATTASTGAFTTLSASSTVSGTGFSTYLASPPAIGGTAAAAGAFTTLSASSTVSGTGFSTYLASPPAIGGTAAAAGAFTTVTATTVNIAASAANAGLTLLRDTGTATRSSRIFLDASGGVTAIYNNANSILFNTSATIGSSSGTNQFIVSHTASAVNYIQITGAGTAAIPTISAQGSDASPSLGFTSKSAGSLVFFTNSSAQRQFRISHTSSAVNYIDATGAAAGAAPVISVVGTDADIDLTLTPKGVGNVRFGTYTGTILTPTGYITIKDSGGTSRRLLVG